LFPFGYGLSYTTFACKNLDVAPESIATGSNSNQAINVTLDVANTGKRAGKEVIELYVGLPSTPAIPQPPKVLKQFAKVSLKPGQTRRISLKLDANSLRCWNAESHNWILLPGTYQVMAGYSSRDLPLQGSFTVKAD
jgi:beta-glucosidase